MKNVGIIAEFNPFHNGHKYLFDAIREELSPDGIVCVMSGDFVQRGFPAITDKWVRAKAAVAEGADLVIELPTVFSLSAAADFAFGGIRILEGLGCISDLAFGSETADINTLKKLSSVDISDNQALKDSLSEGMSYPAALSKVFGFDELLPNDILAVEYLKANKTMIPHAILRKGRGHIATASYIRENMAELENFVPEGAYYELQAAKFWDDESENKLFNMLRYALIMKPAYELADMMGISEGLENVLKKAALSASNIDELIQMSKSKRYTYARISRALMCIALDMDKGLLINAKETPPYAHVLAFNQTGASILKQAKEQGSIDIISNLKKSNVIVSPYKASLENDIQAADLYSILTGRNVREYSDFALNPKL